MFLHCFKYCILLVCLVLCTSCSIYLFKDSPIFNPPPTLLEVAPRILSIEAASDRLVPGRENRVSIQVSFEDLNKDVGPAEIKFLRTLRKLSGNFTLNDNSRLLTEPVTVSGTQGLFEFELSIAIPQGVSGRLEVEIVLYDNADLASDPMTVELRFP